MVHEDGIRAGRDGGVNQGAAGGHAADQFADFGAPLYLQAVGPIVLEAAGLHLGIESGQQVRALRRHEKAFPVQRMARTGSAASGAKGRFLPKRQAALGRGQSVRSIQPICEQS